METPISTIQLNSTIVEFKDKEHLDKLDLFKFSIHNSEHGEYACTNPEIKLDVNTVLLVNILNVLNEESIPCVIDHGTLTINLFT